MNITNNTVATIDYTLTDTAGKIVDSSVGHAPLPYLHGAGNIVPGLEKALDGKETGDTVHVEVTPAEGYGVVNPDLIQDVERTRFPADANITVGMQFQANTPAGPRVVTVVGVTPESVRIDANHPLAGQTLVFDVTIVDVRPATEEELRHGHTHGADGHQHH